jgi:hypothetical protein
MLHVICAVLVLAIALAEIMAMRQWTQQHALLAMQQAGAGATWQSGHPRIHAVPFGEN